MGAEEEGVGAAFITVVMPGLVPGIHVFGGGKKKDMDGRDKCTDRGHG
jgi:hypothetical protein